MAQLRPKIVKLARIIGSVTGIMTKIDENAPEYYSLVNIVSDDEADIAIAAGLRKERTAGWLAKKVGKTIAERAAEKGITEVVFDRGGYLYHGRVSELAAGAREGGLKF